LIDAGDSNLPKVSAAALAAIAKANEKSPYLFRHAGVPCWIELGDDGTPFIQPLNLYRFRHELAQVAIWYRKAANRKKKNALPPMPVVRDLMSSPNLPLPILDRIVETPVYGRDGSLELRPGYHTESRTFYIPPPGLMLERVPLVPSPADLARAKTLILDDLLGDFPFAGDSEKAHAVGLALLPFVRSMIAGPTPLHLVEKPTPGTGATLLVNVLTYPATGRAVAAMSEGETDEEYRKRITAKLRSAPCVIVIDNVRRRLDSGALAAALTSVTWEDRILGQSDVVRVPVRNAWVATGNNPSLSNEMARRTVRIRMDAKSERPWFGRTFRHPDLMSWAAGHRADLVWALLTLIQHWIAVGKPPSAKSLGQFEDWSRTIGGILEAAGIPGFLGNLDELYEESDAEANALRNFFETWHRIHQDSWVTVSALHATALDHLDLGNGSYQSQKIRLGKLLAENKDRNFGNLRLERGAVSHGSQQWRLIAVAG
jgi:hypothetical protein